MAGGTRFELVLSSPEGSTTSYHNGKQGSYTGPNSMERVGTFKETLDNCVSSSGSGVSKSPTPVTPSEILPLSSILKLDLSLGDQKYTRYGELRRALGVSLEEHPFGSLQSKPLAFEELKYYKVGLQEVLTRARDRAKRFQEFRQKVDIYRNLATRKLSRIETASEKSVGISKAGHQINYNLSESVTQKQEERTRNTVPNKRIRSSMVDIRSEGRGSNLSRQGTPMDRDNSNDKEKNMLRTCNGGASPSEYMKKKRSSNSLASRMMDAEREIKQGLPQRLKNESRPRFTDGGSFRLGSSTTPVRVNKSDGSSQPVFGGSRAHTKSDMDNSNHSNDRREHSSVFEKERSLPKGTSKLSLREYSLAGNQGSLTKGKATRPPRTGSVVNSSSTARRSGGTDGWEQLPSNKKQSMIVPNNRKCSLSTGSSSPHVAQWVGQRPQKVRMRRTNLVSPISGHDEPQIVGGSLVSEVGSRLQATGVPCQSKIKLENVTSPAILSESEESGAIENRFKEKVINDDDDGEGVLNTTRKVSMLALPIKKNKLPKEDIGDGVRRLGRSGRGLSQSKPKSKFKAGFSLVKEKPEINHASKPMRNGRSSSNRSESKIGRPSSKKVGDRKTFTRLGNIPNSGSAEIMEECEDDHAELLAAAKYTQNYENQSCSNMFWKAMCPYFSFVGLDCITSMKQQIAFVEELVENFCLDVENKDELVHDVFVSQESRDNLKKDAELGKSSGSTCSFDTAHQVERAFETDEWFKKVIPLSQKLISAILPEYETDCKNDQPDSFSQFATGNSYDNRYFADSVVKDSEATVELEYEVEMAFPSEENCSRENSSCNGYVAPNNFRSPPVTGNHSNLNGVLEENNIPPCSNARFHSEYNQNNVERMQNLGTDCYDVSTSVFQYEHMSLDDKILLELQSIGLNPEPIPDLSDGEDEQIDKDISKFKMKLYQQVIGKKQRIAKLDTSVQDLRMLEESNLEKIAMDKLVEIAYRKFLGGRGNHGSSSKGGMNKVSKQATLAFAKRTLARCHTFENSRKSCFSDPSIRNILLSSPWFSGNVKLNGVHSGVTTYAEAAELHSCQSKGLSDMSEPDRSFSKHETVSSRGKKREVLLDDVVENATFRQTSPLGNLIPGGAKGKRSGREWDQNTSTRSCVAKIGLPPSTGHSKSEQKLKTKPKQKTAQLSTSGILLGRSIKADIKSPLLEEFHYGNERPSFHHSVSQDISIEMEEDIVLSDILQPARDPMEELVVVSDDFEGQAQDFCTWLNVDEDIPPDDDDIMGLDIPMDDLTDLDMKF